MAVPPNVPTSFVPRPASSRIASSVDFGGAFAFVCYAVLLVVVISGIGVFVYGSILASTRAAKDQALTTEEQGIDPATVDSFVRLRDRLLSSKQLLASHVALSGFFEALERVTVSNVRLGSLDVHFDDNQVPQIMVSGIAKNFNALASESVALSGNDKIKDAIFSGIKIDTSTGQVNFSLSGSIASSLIVFAPESLPSTTSASSTEQTTP